MPFKVSFNATYPGVRTGGFSDNFWNSSNDLTVAQAKAQSLYPALYQILGDPCYIPSWHISSINPPRETFNHKVPGSAPNTPTTTQECDFPTISIQLILTGVGGYRSLQWLKGAFDGDISAGGRFVPRALKQPFYQAFLNELTTASNLWCINALLKTTARKPISGFAPTTGVVTCPAHGYGPTGTVLEVRIAGIRSPAEASGIQRVTVIDANSFSINFWVSQPTAIVSVSSPYAVQRIYTQVAISTASYGEATSHKIGRPIGLLGGTRTRRAS